VQNFQYFSYYLHWESGVAVWEAAEEGIEGEAFFLPVRGGFTLTLSTWKNGLSSTRAGTPADLRLAV
jgi:hypothetical protein